VVVKRFTSPHALDDLKQEADILRKIESMVPRVPRLIGRSKQSLVLLMQPVGDQFASRVSHLTQPLVRVWSSAIQPARTRTCTRSR
jgi:hypothetical protein